MYLCQIPVPLKGLQHISKIKTRDNQHVILDGTNLDRHTLGISRNDASKNNEKFIFWCSSSPIQVLSLARYY